MDFDVTNRLLQVHSPFVKYFKKWEYDGSVHQLFIYFNKSITQLGSRHNKSDGRLFRKVLHITCMSSDQLLIINAGRGSKRLVT